MSLYAALCSGVLFPLHEAAKGHSSVAIRRRLEQSQWWPRERIEEARLSRLQDFLSDVGRNVPYFSELLRSLDADPRDIRSLADLGRLPLMTKQTIRENTDRLKARDASGLKRYNTGGSSGEPLVFYIGPGRRSHDVAAKWRATRWWGVDIGDPEIVVWGSPIELGAQDLVRRWRDRMLRTELLPAFEMSEDALDGFLQAIRTRRPRMLFGYPSALALIARHARKRGLAMNEVGIRVAFVTAEKLYDDQRALLADTFGCVVANGYGGRDGGFVAHECPRGGMHLSAEDVIVEIVDPEGRAQPAGQPGEIVVTHLGTRDFPFVRYRTGDIGILDDGACPCGRGLPMLKEIQGRTTDFVVAADGTIMHGLALIYVLRDLPGVQAFKLIQESRARIRVLVVRAPAFSLDTAARIREGLRARLGPGVEVALEFVERIPAEASGKHRYVVSHVAAA